MSSHPYKEFEGTPLWKAIQLAIDDLIENRDIELLTPNDYVIGYLCKVITEEQLFSSSAIKGNQTDEKPSSSLRGSWKGNIPEEIDIEAEVHKIRDEWKNKFDL